jgi:putative Mg2+ transporter-C (MgtC) family protein
MNFLADEAQWKIVERLMVAFVAGVVIGFDRERSGKAAGIRTQMLVCVASALLAGISIYLGPYYHANIADPARLMAQVIAGIGFLGAGVILKNGNQVSGVTTAATIWTTAAVGIGIGSGFYIPSIFAVFLVLMLNPLAFLQYRYGLKGDFYTLKISQRNENRVEKILKDLLIDVRRRSVKNGQLLATIISSNQRNEALRKALKKSKVAYELYASENS